MSGLLENVNLLLSITNYTHVGYLQGEWIQYAAAAAAVNPSILYNYV